MTQEPRLLEILEDSNPIPDPEELVDSEAARELAFRRPTSVLDWRGKDNDYTAGGYRIRLLEPGKWEVTYDDAHLAYETSRRSAFAMVERHHRESGRRRDLAKFAGLFLIAVTALALVDQLASRGSFIWVLIVIGAVFAGTASLARFFAVLSRNLSDPYRRLLPWERQSRQRRD